MSFLATVRWRPRTSEGSEMWQAVVKGVGGDNRLLILDTCEGMEVHFVLEVVESVLLERKG
jgi:hypothetical protein